MTRAGSRSPSRRSALLLRGLLLAVAVVVGAPSPAWAEWAETRKQFRESLKSKEWEKRRTAYSVIADYDGADATEEILSAVGKEQHGLVLASAVKTLAGFRSEGAVKLLGEAARSGRGSRRTYALLALREHKGPGAKDDLLAVLDQPDAQAAAQAALALGAKEVSEAGPKVLRLLAHKDWQVRASAANALRLLGKGAPKEAPAALAAMLAAGEGSERGAAVAALKALTGKDFGFDPEAWRRLAAGEAEAGIPRAPKPLPYVFGIPVYGRRVVVVIDHSPCSDDLHPFEGERLKQVCEVPGARSVPWYTIRTRGQLMAAHAKRLISDLEGSFELITAGRKVRPLFERLNPATAGSREAAARTLTELKTEAGVDTYEALLLAFDTGGKGSASWSAGPDTVVYLSCGNPWLGAITDATVIGGSIGLEGRVRLVPIHTVGVGGHPFVMLRELAERTGGTYADFTK
jgi:hypothetical protein